MKNKKSWIRIVEAFLAVLIVLSAVLIIMSKPKLASFADSDEIYKKQKQILDIIVKNDSLRGSVINNEQDKINDSISRLIPKNWGFATNICNIEQICNTNVPDDRDVYSAEAIVTSTLKEYKPQKIKFFVWMK